MIRLCYSGKSAPSALAIAEASNGEIEAVRSGVGDINWGRSQADSLLNPDISNVTNKRLMRELFASQDVPMPKLFESSPVGLRFPCVGRPDTHTKGRGYWLCNNMADIRQALRGKTYRNGKTKAPATHFMEFVEADREYRVHIFRGKSIRISEKAFFTNVEGLRDYTTAKPTHNVKRVRKAAKRALNAVGLNFGAVDILARGDNNEEVFVLEVNSSPGIGGSLPRLYAENLIRYMESLND